MMEKLRPHHGADVSGPVLHYTNAHQRNDLQKIATTMGHGHSSPHAVSLWEFPRPRSAGSRTTQKHPGLRINIPPRDVVPLSTHTGDEGQNNTIGIALGSPRLIGRRYAGPQGGQQQGPYATAVYTAATKKPKRGPMQRKSSKWRKIGGLFNVNQVRNNRSLSKGSSHPIDRSLHAKAGCEPGSGDKNKGNCSGGIRTCVEAKRKSKAGSKLQSRKSKRSKKHNKYKGPPEPDGNDPAPHLEVEIPNIQMERYSVMFAGLSGQGKPALLARRSKTVDELTSNKKPSKQSKHQSRQSRLSMSFPRTPRRDTPPPRSRTPSFSLFPPIQKSKTIRVLGTPSIPRGPSPLARSETSPAPERDHLLRVPTPLHIPMAPSPVSTATEVSPISPETCKSLPRKQSKLNAEESPARTQEHNQDLSTINTDQSKFPSESTHQDSTSTCSSPVLSPLDKTRQTMDRIGESRLPLSSNNSNPSPQASRQDSIPEASEEGGGAAAATPSPKIEVSVARSVSLSKSKKKQVLVRMDPNAVRNHERLAAEEKLVGKKPQVTDGQFGHRHGNSHDVRIETME